MILCKKNGVVAPCFSCRRFVYAPLKRRPSRIQTLPEFSKEDFEL